MGDGLLSLVGAVIGGIFGPYFLGFWQQHFSRKSISQDPAIRVKEIELRSETLRDIALKFWSHSASELKHENDVLRARIVGLQHEAGILCAQVFPDGHHSRQAAFDLLANVNDSVSGGNFDESDRQMDRNRLLRICSTEAKFRLLVADLRLT